MKIGFMVIACTLLLGACTSERATSVADLTGDAANGKTLFDNNCSGCHGDKGQGGNGGDSIITDHLKDHSDESLLDVIIDGEDSMPAYGEKFSDQELADVMAYVRDLQK